MALEAFYKLKERKKNNILQAVSSCLKKTNYDSLSVNDIAIEADISRGSFYNYFEDKNDAVSCLVESKVKGHFKKYVEAIIACDYKIFDGTRKIYNDISDILKDEINLTIMRNMKFFLELVYEISRSKKYEKDLDELIDWLVNNTAEGKTYLNTKRKMSNVLDMILTLIMNSIFSQIVFKSDSFIKFNDFEYRLEILEKGIK